MMTKIVVENILPALLNNVWILELLEWISLCLQGLIKGQSLESCVAFCWFLSVYFFIFFLFFNVPILNLNYNKKKQHGNYLYDFCCFFIFFFYYKSIYMSSQLLMLRGRKNYIVNAHHNKNEKLAWTTLFIQDV